ncbi:hypothetical protein [Pseudomonas pohangensis]|nr:hypothetical protein [Pseudomonas pohangensis]
MSQLMQFHENAAVIAWWNTRFERALNWLTPVRRRLILAVAAIYIGIVKPLKLMKKEELLGLPEDWLGKAAVVFGLLAILWLIYQAAFRFKTLPMAVRRHPQMTLHGLFWLFLLGLWATPPTLGWPRSVMLGIAVVFPFLIWRCAYLLQAGQQGQAAKTSFRDHIYYLWPAYGGTDTPIGKGHGYLSSCEAKTSEELARSQLRGIKLLLLSVCWDYAAKLMHTLFYGQQSLLGVQGSGIPELAELLVPGSTASIGASWASVYCELFYQVLDHAAAGHKIVGIISLFGFNIFRNTYKPLLAESIVDFWNRYYYYFKEILANFFFMPTFMQLGRRLQNWPNLRLFIAVFAAAFIGNMYYHIIKLHGALAAGDVFGIVYGLRSRFFYCLLLAVGIYVSMRRLQMRAQKPVSTSWLARGKRMFGVWTFFGLIYIWNVSSAADFVTRVEFFASLFGLSNVI